MLLLLLLQISSHAFPFLLALLNAKTSAQFFLLLFRSKVCAHRHTAPPFFSRSALFNKAHRICPFSSSSLSLSLLFPLFSLSRNKRTQSSNHRQATSFFRHFPAKKAHRVISHTAFPSLSSSLSLSHTHFVFSSRVHTSKSSHWTTQVDSGKWTMTSGPVTWTRESSAHRKEDFQKLDYESLFFFLEGGATFDFN